MAKFGQFLFAGELFGEEVVVPAEIEYTRVPWQFIDYSLSQIYEMAINPVEASMPSIQKKITSKPTITGQTVQYEGRPEVQSMSFSGTILTEAQYLVMVSWFNERKQIQIIDDLGQKNWVYLTSFSPKRTRSIQFPWRMEYQAEAKVLDWGNTMTNVWSSAPISTLRKNEATALLPSMRVLPDLNNLSEYSFNTIILQRSLNLILGSNLTLDGKYDIETTDAVAEYQVASGISGFVSGEFGLATRNSLIDKLVLIQSGLA